MSERFQADEEEMDLRRQLADRVGPALARDVDESGLGENKLTADGAKVPLSRNEQESGMQWFGDADRARFFTYSPTMVRSLLRHEYAKIEWVYTTAPDGRNERVQDLSELAAPEDRRAIGGIQVTLPLGALAVKGSPRKHDRHSEIVTTPEEIEGLSEVFADE